MELSNREMKMKTEMQGLRRENKELKKQMREAMAMMENMLTRQEELIELIENHFPGAKEAWESHQKRLN